MSQYQPINQSPEVPDVENPIMDLLIKDEKLQAAADNAFETMRGMSRRLSSLEETDPAYEPLGQIMGVTQLAESADQDYRKAVAEIEALNQTKLMGRFEWLTAMGGTSFGTAGMVLSGLVASTGAGAAVAAGGMAASAVTIAGMNANGERQIVNQAIDEYLEVASRIEKAGQDFDAAWSRLVAEEQPDQDS